MQQKSESGAASLRKECGEEVSEDSASMQSIRLVVSTFRAWSAEDPTPVWDGQEYCFTESPRLKQVGDIIVGVERFVGKCRQIQLSGG